MFRPKNILAPTDFSEDSNQAFQTALSIAAVYKARVFLLHVISDTMQRSLSEYCHDTNIVNRVLSEGVVYSNEKLREMIDKAQSNGNVKVIADVRKGQPYEEILNEADERNVDLIVIAPHGETGLRKFFIGSVTEKVMKESRCPVLLVRGQDKGE